MKQFLNEEHNKFASLFSNARSYAILEHYEWKTPFYKLMVPHLFEHYRKFGMPSLKDVMNIGRVVANTLEGAEKSLFLLSLNNVENYKLRF